MRKLLLTLLAAVVASGAFAQAFPDVPENHWAADAVSDIADLGIVIGFPDGTFRGNEAFTRYQASLVVARMLDVIGEDIDARLALTDEDIASLRNALQELASDVAAQGADVAALSDDVAAAQSRIDDLEAQLANAGDSEAIQDLLNQLASQRVAIDTAQAQAEAAEELANRALGRANAADSRARQNQDAISALNRIAQNLGNRVSDLERGLMAAVPDSLLDQVNQNTADIADLQDRVTALEENPLGLSGTITVTYEVQRLLGPVFDVDRAYGLNNDRDMGQSVFSTGTRDYNRNGRMDVGDRAQDRADVTGEDTPVTVELEPEFGFENVFGSTGPDGTNFTASAKLTLAQVAGVEVGGDTLPLVDPDGDPISFPFVFSISEFAGIFDDIGGAEIRFAFGDELTAQWTPYIAPLYETPGFVASVSSPDFLSFLDPTLSVVYSGVDSAEDDVLDTFTTGVRLTLAPLEGVTLGGTYTARAENAGDKDDVDQDNEEVVVFGVDGSVAGLLNLVDIDFEYANATDENDDSLSLAYVTVDFAPENLPVLESLSVNYRDIPGTWEDMVWFDELDDDALDPTFDYDQAGFKVEADLSLFVVDLGAYFDQYVTGTPNASVNAFGVDVSVPVFAGFEVTGFYNQISVRNDDDPASEFVAVDSARTPRGAQPDGFAPGTALPTVVAGDVERDDNYETGFGIGLAHDGEAENALVPGLNLEFEYRQMEADFSRNEIEASADMDFDISIVSLSPYVSFLNRVDGDVDTTSYDATTIRVGAGLETQALDVFFQPNLMAAVNYRTTGYSDDYRDGNDEEWTAEEFQWSVGLVLNEFLFENSSFTAKYGSWTGTNLSTARHTPGERHDSAADATDISAADANNDVEQYTRGYELVWNYSGLELAYGNYEAAQFGGDDASSGQVFSISYEVEF